MGRDRTAKQLGTRYHLPFINRSVRFNLKRLALYAGPALVCFLVVIGMASAKRHSIFSAGPLSSSHAFLADKCEACHSQATGFRQQVTDEKCRDCHEGDQTGKVPDHQQKQVKNEVPSCGSCHIEHRGAVGQTQTPSQRCVACHGQASLLTEDPQHPSLFKAGITRFDEHHHPKFSAEAGELNNPTTIAFSHAAHLCLKDSKESKDNKGSDDSNDKLCLKDSNDKPVNLQCSDCHRPVAEDSTPWRFVAPRVEKINFQPTPKPAPKAYPDQNLFPDSGRMIMTMPKYAESCATGPCHNLTFAEKVLPVDHPKSKEFLSKVPEQVRAFIEDYKKNNNGSLPSVFSDWSPQCACDRTAHPVTKILEKPEESVPKTDQQRMEARIKDGEKFLWNARCRLCHKADAASAGPGQASTTKLEDPDWNPKTWADSKIMQRFMPYAVFSHQVHGPIACEGCHVPPSRPHCCEKTKPDVIAQSHDIHMPGIATCVQCHNASPARDGHAENGCFLCHQYHPWNPARQMFRSQHTIEEFTGWKAPEPQPTGN